MLHVDLVKMLCQDITPLYHFYAIIQRKYEPRRKKTGLRVFRQGPTQTGLYSHRRWLEAGNLGIKKERGCAIFVAKTKELIS